jgi:CheY-like chemotaxis protein
VPVNILVAEDSVTMRRILELTFQGEDAKVVSVNDADAALRKAAELSPDVVFVDVAMSGMDGYTLASAIKSAPGGERTAVILLASQKHPYDDDKGKAAGVDDHLLKPFDTQHAIDRVKQVMGKPRVSPAAGAAPSGTDRQSRVGGKTIAFGKPPAAVPQAPPAAPSMPRPQPMAAPARPAPAPAASPIAASVGAKTAAGSDLAHKLDGLGLTAEQVQGVLALSRDVIEKVVWEVVPDLAETIIKDEIRRLTAG